MTTPAVGQVYQPRNTVSAVWHYECIGIAYYPDYAFTPGPQVWLERLTAVGWRVRIPLDKFQEGWEVADVPPR